MTTFAPANLPASVDTLEKLVVWACGAYYQLHKNDTYAEADSSPLIPVITAQDGRAADKTERVIFRVSIQLNDTWRESTLKIFQEAVEMASTPIPSGFLP